MSPSNRDEWLGDLWGRMDDDGSDELLDQHDIDANRADEQRDEE
jgi:hypothetical protein